MRNLLLLFGLISLVAAGVVSAQEMPVSNSGQAEHEWLKRLAGEWEYTAEFSMGAGTEPMKMSGTESATMLGNIWLVANGTIGPADQGMHTVLTIGYNPDKKVFVGTWIDSMQNFMWHYEGTLDEARKTLTLAAEGPSMQQAGKTGNYRDIIEIVDADHKTLTSMLQGDDGEWTRFGIISFVRKKK